jgi:hypothetical protein
MGGNRNVPFEFLMLQKCKKTLHLSRILKNNPELHSNLAFGVWNLGLPQFDRIPFRVMQVGEAAVGIRLRINLDRDARSLQLGRHFVQVPHPQVQHPVLLGIPEILAGLREGGERGWSRLLLPTGLPVAGWYRQNPQVLLLPESQRFRVFGSKEESTDSGHFFGFRFRGDPIANSGPPSGRGSLWLCGCLRSHAELVPIPEEARPESNRQGSQHLASWKNHPILLTKMARRATIPAQADFWEAQKSGFGRFTNCSGRPAGLP